MYNDLEAILYSALAFYCQCVFPFSEGGCGDPGTPEHGRKLGVTYSVNSVVYFNCDLGYELVGSPDRKCQLDGTWTGTQPICKGVARRV